MKVINKQNQHEIGFDIKCLPAWAKYIAMDSDGYWSFYECEPSLESVQWEAICLFSLIPEEHEPKNFTGNWEDSLFFIDRSIMVKYNGTAI